MPLVTSLNMNVCHLVLLTMLVTMTYDLKALKTQHMCTRLYSFSAVMTDPGM